MVRPTRYMEQGKCDFRTYRARGRQDTEVYRRNCTPLPQYTWSATWAKGPEKRTGEWTAGNCCPA